MKLILAIVSADAVDPVSRVLVEKKFSVTQISSVGGFMRKGNTTLVVGVQETQLQDALAQIRKACESVKSEHHPATIFVLDAAQFVQM
jgi:uncharacterized protein YaaQ